MHPQSEDLGALVTHAEAARILGVGVSNIPKMIRRGDLVSRGRMGRLPSLRRDQVEQLAKARAHDRLTAARRRATPPEPKPVPGPVPADGHAWLTPEQAGAVIGITGQAVRKRCYRGTIPHARLDGRWWIREDHARLAAHARATSDDLDVASIRTRVLG